MSEISWSTRSIRECLAESFAGEWGGEPLPGNARVLRATDIDDDGHVTGPGALRRLPIGKLTSRQLEDGDILLEGSGGGPDKPVGRVAFFDAAEHQGPAVCSNFFKTLRPEPRMVEPRFLWRKLIWFYRQPMLLTFQQQTTGIINLKFEEYLNAVIEVPADLAEQRAIAQILDTLDTAIRETEALIDKLKAVKQGLLHDLLTRGIDANGQLRPPQSEAPQLYKESPLGWIPREWEVMPLSEACTHIVDCPHSTPHFQDEGALVARTMHIKDGVFLEKMASRVSTREYRERIARLEPASGDLIFTREAPVGEACVIPEGMQICLGQRVMLLRPQTGKLTSTYLLAQIYSGSVKDRIALLTSGTTNPHLNVSEVKRFEIPLPSAEEQTLIADRISSLEDRIQFERAQLEKLLQQKSGLMDDLLTGRVRVTPLLESVQQPAAQTGA